MEKNENKSLSIYRIESGGKPISGVKTVMRGFYTDMYNESLIFEKACFEKTTDLWEVKNVVIKEGLGKSESKKIEAFIPNIISPVMDLWFKMLIGNSWNIPAFFFMQEKDKTGVILFEDNRRADWKDNALFLLEVVGAEMSSIMISDVRCENVLEEKDERHNTMSSSAAFLSDPFSIRPSLNGGFKW